LKFLGNVVTERDSVSENDDVEVLHLFAEEQIANEPSDNECLRRGPVCNLADSLQQRILYFNVL
jgi:hypothetical protein